MATTKNSTYIVFNNDDDDINPAPEGQKLEDCSNKTRNEFIIKVYIVVCLQLLTSLIFGIITYTSKSVQDYVLSSPGTYIISIIALFVSLLLLMCLKHKYPLNIILLSIFTLSMSYGLGIVCLSYSPKIVFQALVLTFGITFGLSLFTWYNKEKDFSILGNILFGFMIILFIGSIFQLFFSFGGIGETLWACFGALIFAGYIIFDTWLILRKYSENEWIMASINLYLDIINLFLYLLRLLRSLQRD
jgi:hypothetical protein